MKLIRLEVYGIALGLLVTLAALGLGRLFPDSELYAYTLPWRSEAAVYVMDISRGVSVPITKSLPPADAYRLPALSPDEQQIVVTVAVPAGSLLYRLDIWSGAQNALGIQSAYDDQAVWSPDGRWIAFTALRDAVRDIYITQVGSGTNQALTAFPSDATQPSWSPDGEKIAYVNGQSLYVMAAHCPEIAGVCSKNAQQLTSSAGSDSFPVWSPDGTQIAFVSNRSRRAEVYVMDVGCLDSSASCLQQNPRQLTQGLGRLQTLSWSAEHGLLGFISDQYGRAGLYSLQADCEVLAECTIAPLVLLRP